jgi:cysteinyl-tRNA synthetase
MRIYNTLSRSIEDLKPLAPPDVGLYSCGPTVYDYTHIGHLRKYINDDILVRTLRANGYKVRHVMNITDVGHLTSDQDAGEDKLEKGAAKLGKSVLEVAKYFEDDFWKSLKLVNVEKPDVVARATEHIEDQIALIETLIGKGFAYKTDQAVYFDVSKFPNYTKLSGQSLSEKIKGARGNVVVDQEKRNPADFALWFFTVGRFVNHSLRWGSPWGEGFPGWHIECSAMSMKYLGLSFDIHTGGIDHIPVHHTNEIAQSEAATGKPFVKIWVHSAFLNVEEEKMSKAKGNIFRISELVEQGYNPLAFRYLAFQTHYRSEMSFTLEGLSAAKLALDKLYERASGFSEVHKNADIDFERDFLESLSNDLNMPQALSVMWEMLGSKKQDSVKAATLYKMDEILGLKIKENAAKLTDIPENIIKLVREREHLRGLKKFVKADHLRNRIEKMGYILDDEENRTKVLRKL